MDIGFDNDMVKNIALVYHIKSINAYKNILIELKNMTNANDADTVLQCNEYLAETLNKAEKYYTAYVNKYSFSKEAVQLYSLFLKNIMVIEL